MKPGPMGAGPGGSRVRGSHIRRKAIVYVRQSTPGQVERHRESTRLQYGLTGRARQLGWAEVDIDVIDEDLGVSARHSGTREGFAMMAAAVGLGGVGIVIVSELSRLARNLSDWGRLLELCGRNDTLIADVESVYDLQQPNDRFLLGIKGTVSEAEIHTLCQRMHTGREAKAARGELSVPLPRGYARDAAGRVAFDPDASVRERIRYVFSTFARLGSLSGTLRALAADGHGLPQRYARGPGRGELAWPEPNSAALYSILTSPVYAGAFAWGRRRGANAGTPVAERWRHLLRDRHPAYIGWEEFELNLRQLAGNRWPVRCLGGGLLTGLLRCGRCGRAMTVSYRDGGGEGLRYSCRGRAHLGGPACQSLSSPALEDFASDAALNALSPASVELSLAALRQAEAGRAAEHEQWRLRIARAGQDAAGARRAYLAVDPGNRLVAQALEDEWEAAIGACRRLEDAHARFCRRTPPDLSARERDAIAAAASQIAALWAGGKLAKSEKSEILRLMVDRVTAEVVGDSERVKVEVEWHGGARSRAEIRRPVRNARQLSYYGELRDRIAGLEEAGKAPGEIAAALNAAGLRPARRAAFTAKSVERFLRSKNGGGRPRRRRRPQPGDRRPDEWLIEEICARTGVPETTLYGWIYKGKLAARKDRPAAEGGSGRLLIHADRRTRQAIRSWAGRPGTPGTRRLPDFRTDPECPRAVPAAQ